MFSKQIILLPIALSLMLYAKASDDVEYTHRYYCRLDSCSNPSRHVMCLYPSLSVSENCGIPENVARSGLTSQEKGIFMKAHIDVRKEYFLRKNKSVTFPEMHWDYDLEEMAQRWANQCSEENDECRSINDMGYVVKQNVGHYTYQDSFLPLQKKGSLDIKKIVNDWAQQKYNPVNPSIKKFRDIDRIACGLTVMLGCKWYTQTYQLIGTCVNYYHAYVVCNYGISPLRYSVSIRPVAQ